MAGWQGGWVTGSETIEVIASSRLLAGVLELGATMLFCVLKFLVLQSFCLPLPHFPSVLFLRVCILRGSVSPW